MTPPVLDVQGPTRGFYGVHALRGADLAVREGTMTGLIGPNGAGETTAFDCISGVVPPGAGRVLLTGEDVAGLRPDEIARRGLATTSSGSCLFLGMGQHPPSRPNST